MSKIFLKTIDKYKTGCYNTFVEWLFNYQIYLRGEKMAKLTCDCEVIHQDVVNKVKEKMSDDSEYIALASLFKIFGDSTRIKILHALRQNEMCVCDIASLLKLTKSAVSHQLKALRLANLVKYRKEAQIVYYSLADTHVEKILDIGIEHLRE